jgi:hypothetical protein
MYTKAAASSALFLPIWNAVGFRMVLKQSVKQIWYLISVTGDIQLNVKNGQFDEIQETNDTYQSIGNPPILRFGWISCIMPNDFYDLRCDYHQ